MNYFSLDTEDDSHGNIQLAIFFDGFRFTVFERKDLASFEFKNKIVNHILMLPEKSVLYCHNAEYDLASIFFPDHYKEIDFYYSGRLIFAIVHANQVKVLDSFNYSFTSLKEVGKSINLEKLETDEKGFVNVKYCKRDTEIVFRYMENFNQNIRDEFQIRKVASTIAGNSMKIFLKKFAHDCTEINCNPEILNGYYGGRTECFYIGEMKNVFEMDVNSMYPHVMKHCKYPVSEYSESPEPISRDYIAQIKVKVRPCDYPVLPYRTDKLLFPVGEFETWATSAEINYAKSLKQIEKLEYLRVFNFSDMQFIFAEYVDYFYTKRKAAKDAGDKFLSKFYKDFLNSLYGKFATHKGIQILTALTPENMNEGRPLNDYMIMIEKTIDSDKGKNFGIACFVTAYARIELHKMISKIASLGFNPLYCDTDSCYFSGGDIFKDTKKLFERFNIGNELGGVSLKLNARAEFFNVKQYYTIDFFKEEKYKTKGIPKKFRKQFIETERVTYQKPMKLRPALTGRKGIQINEWYDFEVVKRTVYSKRTVLNNGFTEALKI